MKYETGIDSQSKKGVEDLFEYFDGDQEAALSAFFTNNEISNFVESNKIVTVFAIKKSIAQAFGQKFYKHCTFKDIEIINKKNEEFSLSISKVAQKCLHIKDIDFSILYDEEETIVTSLVEISKSKKKKTTIF